MPVVTVLAVVHNRARSVECPLKPPRNSAGRLKSVLAVTSHAAATGSGSTRLSGAEGVDEPGAQDGRSAQFGSPHPFGAGAAWHQQVGVAAAQAVRHHGTHQVCEKDQVRLRAFVVHTCAQPAPDTRAARSLSIHRHLCQRGSLQWRCKVRLCRKSSGFKPSMNFSAGRCFGVKSSLFHLCQDVLSQAASLDPM